MTKNCKLELMVSILQSDLIESELNLVSGNLDSTIVIGVDDCLEASVETSNPKETIQTQQFFVSDLIIANRSSDCSNSLVDNVNYDGIMDLDMVTTNRNQEVVGMVSEDGSTELKSNVADEVMDSDGSRDSQEAFAASIFTRNKGLKEDIGSVFQVSKAQIAGSADSSDAVMIENLVPVNLDSSSTLVEAMDLEGLDKNKLMQGSKCKMKTSSKV
ncbi:hypothetical protein L1887_39176 [Cichorium endivia]|nr:hypothetical protein L1887_39176 [Cichorium endivia]